MKMNYPILLFDADNTLLDFTKTEEHAFQETMQKHGYCCDEEVKKTYDTINHRLWKQFERGEITRDQVVFTRFGILFEALGVNADGVAFEKEYQETLGEGSYLIDGALELLEILKKEEGCQCYIVTNGVARTQHRRLKESGIIRYVDGIFISEEIGCQKPSSQFFDVVFATIGEEKRKDALIVGDSLTSDILGGNHAGIKTCWYNPEGMKNKTQAVADYEIQKWDELYDILGIKKV